MKKVLRYVTSDDNTHLTYEDAKRHNDARYGDRLCKITRMIVMQDGKYNKILDFVDLNLALFLELQAIKEDDVVEDAGDDDD